MRKENAVINSMSKKNDGCGKFSEIRFLRKKTANLKNKTEKSEFSTFYQQILA